jgi:hypothetical protein
VRQAIGLGHGLSLGLGHGNFLPYDALPCNVPLFLVCESVGWRERKTKR